MDPRLPILISSPTDLFEDGSPTTEKSIFSPFLLRYFITAGQP